MEVGRAATKWKDGWAAIAVLLWVAVVVGGASAGCGNDAEPGSCKVRCGGNGLCPSGLPSCGADGYCHRSGDTVLCEGADGGKGDAAVADTPAADAPAGDAPVGDAPAGDAVVGDERDGTGGEDGVGGSDGGGGCGSCGTCADCVGGACVAVKNADHATCNGGSTCDAAGKCKKRNGQGCSTASECGSGNCTDSVCLGPSCAGLAATCGPYGNESCCTSLLVPGGTYNRSNDSRYPATVSDFRLDKYEVTVGRFRKFVEAGKGTQAGTPAAGEGAHPSIAGSGWDASWNGNLPADTTALIAAMSCGAMYQTWTDVAGRWENRPIDCIAWWEAFAFCAWDGGRLATEAEWNYAAAGGSEQRVYPWSNPPASTTIDETYAVYCDWSCNTTLNVGSKSPRGDGKWGHADLAGNVWEWTLDWYGVYHVPCTNCASLVVASDRVIRGDGFYGSNSYLDSASRKGSVPGTRYVDVGTRCARAP